MCLLKCFGGTYGGKGKKKEEKKEEKKGNYYGVFSPWFKHPEFEQWINYKKSHVF